MVCDFLDKKREIDQKTKQNTKNEKLQVEFWNSLMFLSVCLFNENNEVLVIRAQSRQ